MTTFALAQRSRAGSNYTFLTDKERDKETGLDWFDSRYYSSSQGRFSSPDSYSGRVTDPQTFKLYSYVRNNPLKYIDPTGHQAQKPKNKKRDIENPDCTECDLLYTDSERPEKPKNLTGAVVGGVVAPPQTFFEFEYRLNPRAAPAIPGPATPPAAAPSGGFLSLLKLLGAAGFILANPTTMGGGDTHPTPAPDTSANPNPEDNKPDTGDKTNDDQDVRLYRFGWRAETAEGLGDQAAAAQANPGVGIHGVSVNTNANLPAPYAMKSEVEKLFQVMKTTRDPGHYTVVLPRPVTPATARAFNLLFRRRIR